ncbi:ABC transporter ATP-binding protein [Salipaludibacillus sp. HK11]|uniref:ABC transporter ATP-binding protein n=1 Tax=Salipaludibacillus sp. HK11 TaxID=3394320 RepID=UPI0039FBDCDB
MNHEQPIDNDEPLLSVKHLRTEFISKKKKNITVVDDISFNVHDGEILAIVGESGSGKSITSLSIMGLLKTGGKVTNGEIFYNGKNILDFTKKQRRQLRGNDMAMIFQEPMSSLNPMIKIKSQISEAIRIHNPKVNSGKINDQVVDLLTQVETPDAVNVANRYPHQLSGGMRQRVMIAIAIACNPKLLIADEPTTALDVTIQAQILNLIKDLNEKSNTGVILITHDLSVVADVADRVLVMYAGKIVEEASVYDLFSDPQHPYTNGLMRSMPKMESQDSMLEVIPGTMPDLQKKPGGCPFHPRCARATSECIDKLPKLEESHANSNHLVRCYYPGKEGVRHE